MYIFFFWLNVDDQVTLLVAIEGKHKMATINSSDDLKKALENLGSIPSKNIAVWNCYFINKQ